MRCRFSDRYLKGLCRTGFIQYRWIAIIGDIALLNRQGKNRLEKVCPIRAGWTDLLVDFSLCVWLSLYMLGGLQQLRMLDYLWHRVKKGIGSSSTK